MKPRLAPRVARPAAAILLGAAAVVWAAVPLVHHGFATLALLVAIVFVTGGALRLALGWIPLPEDAFLLPGAVRAWTGFLQFLRMPPWEEVAAADLVWLEVQHSSRPWHTAVLGLVLVAYLLAVHLAESRALVLSLRPLSLALGTGVALLAAAAGFAMLPAFAPGPGAAWLRVLAGLAVLSAAALALPRA